MVRVCGRKCSNNSHQGLGMKNFGLGPWRLSTFFERKPIEFIDHPQWKNRFWNICDHIEKFYFIYIYIQVF